MPPAAARDAAMLIAITLQLLPTQDALLPPHLGRAAYAALLDWMREQDPALAGAIHDQAGPKPLTCSSVRGARSLRDGLGVRAGSLCSVRYTGLTAEVAHALEALLANPPARWRLDAHTFTVAGAICDPAQDGWTGRSSCEALMTAEMTRGDAPERSVRLEFAAPIAFKSAGLTVPLPLPGLLFGSLVDRWNSVSPAALSSEMRRFGEEMVALSRYRLESRAVGQKNEGLRIGGVGEATYRALGSDRYWLGAFHALAGFALYSGAGVQTTAGMGQLRRLPGRGG